MRASCHDVPWMRCSVWLMACQRLPLFSFFELQSLFFQRLLKSVSEHVRAIDKSEILSWPNLADAPLISACRWTNPTIFSSTGPRILVLRHREQRCALPKRSCKWSWRCRAVPHCVTPPGEHGLACWSSPWLRSIWLTATYRSQASTYRALCVCLGSGSSLPPATPQEYCLSKAGDHTEMLVCKYKHCSSRPKNSEDRAIIISGRFMASPSLLSRWAALAWRNTCTCRHGRTGEMDKQIKGLWHSNGTWNWKHSQRLQKLPQKDSTSFQEVEIATGVKRAFVASSFSNTQASQAVETQTGIRVRSAASACISLGVVLLCFYVLLSQRLSHFSVSFLLICGHQKQTSFLYSYIYIYVIYLYLIQYISILV